MGFIRPFMIRHKPLQIAIAATCFLTLAGFLLRFQTCPSLPIPWKGTEVMGLTKAPPLKPLVKPEGVIVSGFVFYGRKSRVSSMRCYLERNLVDNGGWLHEVLWVANTQNEGDLDYLDEIIASNPEKYKKIIPEKPLSTYTYYKVWQLLERGKYYVKIDDDILWIDDNAILNLVTRKVDYPEDFVVSGNIINNPPLGFMHFRIGALHPYFPESEQPSHVPYGADYWKPSRHGFWDGPKNFTLDIEKPPPAWPQHRWLSVQEDTMIYQTPINKLKYERNLVDNGGWLHEVLWVANTQNEGDLDYLDEIIASNPEKYKKIIPEKPLSTYTYYKVWQLLERGKYYVKIDDDILWIDDNAILNLVTRKVDYPEDFVVSGNIINNPPLGFMHFRIGALHPYFPESEQPSHVPYGADYWKPSRHGFWDGPKNFTLDIEKPPPAWPQHRWLSVQEDTMIYQTPINKLKYEVWGSSYQAWSIAAQMHYSLLENIENNALDLYKFEKPWTMYGDRIRINFMCIYADDILDTDPEHSPKGRGDEDMIVLDLPKTLRRPVVVQGDALAAHFQYEHQGGLGDTDLLKRYLALAQDRYCLNATFTGL
ncbi:hypothetical protein FOMG_17808 [Fusarium oxysporum f. sp. melonis 26406]|uniref:Uncharacterized protein n=1 Tax=Fusarium oxysporum f. sp. melonis 26406 TaxID=1089452 RepID=W9ZWV3_FUSOX|nr:hypothetical protein FOMG_17808 [Fusarium oxysporum f. sp. melonis 26406]